MGHNDFDQDIQQSDGSPWPDCPEDEAATTAMVRLRARLFAGRLDRELDAGAVPMPGSALAAHVARLTTVDEREALARALRHAMAEAHHAAAGVPLRIPVNWESMIPCRDVVDDITLRLHSPRPVRARGVARLRILLSDGTGPLYKEGRGSLPAGLRGVLAAL
mgnify:FL=1